MNGNNLLEAAIIGGASLDWGISDVGDYNGDGFDDILWRYTDGSLAMWVMNCFSVSDAQVIGFVPSEGGII
jgi:hypothetical protein